MADNIARILPPPPSTSIRLSVEPVQVELEPADGSLLFSVLQSAFPHATGIYFRPKGVDCRAMLKFDGRRFLAPNGGWNNGMEYFVELGGNRHNPFPFGSYEHASKQFERSVNLVQQMMNGSSIQLNGKKARIGSGGHQHIRQSANVENQQPHSPNPPSMHQPNQNIGDGLRQNEIGEFFPANGQMLLKDNEENEHFSYHQNQQYSQNEAIKQICDGLRKDDAAMFPLVEMLDSLVVNDPAHHDSIILCSSEKILFMPSGEGIDLNKVISFNIGAKTFCIEQIDGDPLYDWPKNYSRPKLAIFKDKLYLPSVSFDGMINDGYFFRKEIRELWIIDLHWEQLKWTKTFLAPESTISYYASTAFNATGTRIYLFDCRREEEERNPSDCPEICSFYLKPPTLSEIAKEKIVGLIGKNIWKKAAEPNYATITYSTNIKNFFVFLNSFNN